MKIEELKKELIRNNINLKACLINPIICPEGALCIKKNEHNNWVVILNERGEFRINEKFNSEHDACRFFLLNVFSDPTYINDFKSEDLINFEIQKNALLNKYDF
ncbi:MAG: hypothetical protein JXR79_09150 [Nitrospirae bacterium]|nr:hypothetical protein [Nitrospirota bacterium]